MTSAGTVRSLCLCSLSSLQRVYGPAFMRVGRLLRVWACLCLDGDAMHVVCLYSLGLPAGRFKWAAMPSLGLQSVPTVTVQHHCLMCLPAVHGLGVPPALNVPSALFLLFPCSMLVCEFQALGPEIRAALGQSSHAEGADASLPLASPHKLQCTSVCRYTSQVFLKPGRQVISKVYDSTLFDHLDSTWDFAVGPAPTSTWLTFSVDFGFKSPLYRHIAAVFFEEVGCIALSVFSVRVMLL